MSDPMHPALCHPWFRHKLFRLSPGLIALLPVLMAQAQTTTPDSTPAASVQTLDPVLVTTRRGSNTNTVVRANRIELEQANSLQDLFKQTPEVSIGGGALPVAQKLYVRGLSERMLTITIDGAAQPESAYHHNGQVMIEPELLKRVEIEAGTGAASAGPGALAGALRFTTKSARDLLRPGQHIGAMLKTGYQSNNEGYKVAGTVFGRLSENLEFLLNGTHLNSGDYHDGHGNPVANSATSARASFAKLDGKLGDHHWQLAHQRHADQGLRNQRTNLLLAAFNPSQRQRSERESSTLHYAYRPDNPLLALQVTLYRNDNAILLAQDSPRAEHDGTRSHGLNVRNVARLKQHKFSYGFDYRHDLGYARVAGNSLPDERASVTGVFVQDEWSIGQYWVLAAGARHDTYRYTDMTRRNIDASGTSPNLGLTLLATDQVTLRLSHSRALRGVGVLEPFLKSFQGNAAILHPEKARNNELGLQWQNGDWQANASVFQQTIDNYIGYDDARQNLGQVKVRGYSASAAYRHANSSISLGLAQARPSLNGQPLSSAEALLLGNASGRTWVAQYDQALPAHHLKLGWTARLPEQLSFVPLGQANKAGYVVHDMYAQWLPLGKDGLSLTWSVKNLFNQFYYDQSSFGYHPRWGKIAALPEAGRDIRLSLGVRF